MDRLGVPFNRTPEGFLDQRRFGGTLFKRTAFAGATTGQQLLYALDEQVRRWEVGRQGEEVRVLGFPGPDPRRQRRLPRRVAQDLVTMEIRAFPGRRGDRRHRRAGPDLRPLDDVDGLHRQRRQPLLSVGGEVRQRRVHPGPSHGHSRRRQAAADERIGPRRRGPRVGAAQAAGPARPADAFPKASATTSSKSAIRSTATSCRATSPRARFSTSARTKGCRVEKDRLCVYLDLTHIPQAGARPQARRHSRNLREVPGRRSAHDADEDFPRRPLLDGRPVGRLRADRRRAAWSSARRRTR